MRPSGRSTWPGLRLATPRYVVDTATTRPTRTHRAALVSETIGDPMPWGRRHRMNTSIPSAGLPPNPSRTTSTTPSFSAASVTDRNYNQMIYDFNAAQMPVQVEVHPHPAEDRHPRLRRSPVSSPGRSTTAEPAPAAGLARGQQRGVPVRDGNVPGVGFYNRRVGALARRTAYPGNPFSAVIPALRARQQRPNPTHASPSFTTRSSTSPARDPAPRQPDRRRGGPFPPQNGGRQPRGTPRSPRTISRRTPRPWSPAMSTLLGNLDLTVRQVEALYSFVNTQLARPG